MTDPHTIPDPLHAGARLRVLETWPDQFPDDPPVWWVYEWAGPGVGWSAVILPPKWAGKTLRPGDRVLNRDATYRERQLAYDRDEGLFLRWEWAL